MSDSVVGRHYEDEEFPEHCDHCPREFGLAEPYRRVQFVIDAAESRVGVDRASVENSFELVLCSLCAQRIERWVRTPLSVEPVDDVPPADELDDQELADALEKELAILASDPPVARLQPVRIGTPAPKVAPEAFAGEQRRETRLERVRRLGERSVVEEQIFDLEAELLADEEPSSLEPGAGPCLDPDRMHGAGDQFPGQDFFPSDEERRS